MQMTIPKFRSLILETLKKADQNKKRGSSRYREGDIEQAIECYLEAMDDVDGILAQESMKRPDMGDLRSRLNRVRLPTCLNLSLCYVKQKQFSDAEDYAREALSIDSRHVKALYRLAESLLYQMKNDDCINSLEEAHKLDPLNFDVSNLMKKARYEQKTQDKVQRQAYQGLFSKSSYVAAVDEDDRRRQREESAERRPLSRDLKDFYEHAMKADGGDDISITLEGIIDRWSSSGVSALDDSERLLLQNFVKRAAASGRLDKQEQRALLTKYGLGAAFTRKGFEESLNEDERERWDEQQNLLKMKQLIAKTKNNESLSDLETKTLKDYLEEEIARYEAKKSDGLSQEEIFLLSKLKEKRDQINATQVSDNDKMAYMEGLMKKIDSNQRVPVRERLQIVKMLEEEEQNLQSKDDEQGLTSSELSLLTQLTRHRKEREKQKKEREMKRKIMENSKREAEQASYDRGDIIC